MKKFLDRFELWLLFFSSSLSFLKIQINKSSKSSSSKNDFQEFYSILKDFYKIIVPWSIWSSFEESVEEKLRQEKKHLTLTCLPLCLNKCQVKHNHEFLSCPCLSFFNSSSFFKVIFYAQGKCFGPLYFPNLFHRVQNQWDILSGCS